MEETKNCYSGENFSNTPTSPRPIWTAIKLCILYLLLQLVATVVLVGGMLIARLAKMDGDPSVLLKQLSTESSDMFTSPMVLGLSVVLSAVLMLIHLVRKRYIRIDAHFLRHKGAGWVLLLCLPLVYTVMYLLNVLNEWMNLTNLLEDQFIDMSHNVWGVLSIALAAPVVEECLFRGAIEGRMLKVWHPWVAICVSALFFGLIHMNPAQIPFAFLCGVLFGWLRWKTGSLLPGIVGHILNNSIACLTMFLYGADANTLEESLGESVQPIIWVAYGVIAVTIVVVLCKKIFPSCNFSDDTAVK